MHSGCLSTGVPQGKEAHVCPWREGWGAGQSLPVPFLRAAWSTGPCSLARLEGSFQVALQGDSVAGRLLGPQPLASWEVTC